MDESLKQAKLLSRDEYAQNKNIGDFTEDICKEYFSQFGSITPAPQKYFPYWDFYVENEIRRTYLEVKSDSSYEYNWSGNVVIEYAEISIHDESKPSGISLSESDYYCIVMHKMNKIFVFKTDELREYINRKDIFNNCYTLAKGKNHSVKVKIDKYPYKIKTITY